MSEKGDIWTVGFRCPPVVRRWIQLQLLEAGVSQSAFITALLLSNLGKVPVVLSIATKPRLRRLAKAAALQVGEAPQGAPDAIGEFRAPQDVESETSSETPKRPSKPPSRKPARAKLVSEPPVDVSALVPAPPGELTKARVARTKASSETPKRPRKRPSHKPSAEETRHLRLVSEAPPPPEPALDPEQALARARETLSYPGNFLVDAANEAIVNYLRATNQSTKTISEVPELAEAKRSRVHILRTWRRVRLEKVREISQLNHELNSLNGRKKRIAKARRNGKIRELEHFDRSIRLSERPLLELLFNYDAKCADSKTRI